MIHYAKTELLTIAYLEKGTHEYPVILLLHGSDGVNPPYVSENVHEKFTGPINRIVMPDIGYVPSREFARIIS